MSWPTSLALDLSLAAPRAPQSAPRSAPTQGTDDFSQWMQRAQLAVQPAPAPDSPVPTLPPTLSPSDGESENPAAEVEPPSSEAAGGNASLSLLSLFVGPPAGLREAGESTPASTTPLDPVTSSLCPLDPQALGVRNAVEPTPSSTTPLDPVTSSLCPPDRQAMGVRNTVEPATSSIGRTDTNTISPSPASGDSAGMAELPADLATPPNGQPEQTVRAPAPSPNTPREDGPTNGAPPSNQRTPAPMDRMTPSAHAVTKPAASETSPPQNASSLGLVDRNEIHLNGVALEPAEASHEPALGGATSLSPQVERRGDKNVAAPMGQFVVGEQVRKEQGAFNESPRGFSTEQNWDSLPSRPESAGKTLSGFMVPVSAPKQGEAFHEPLGGATSLSPQVEGRGDKNAAAPMGQFVVGEQVRKEQGAFNESPRGFSTEQNWDSLPSRPESAGKTLSGFMVPVSAPKQGEAFHEPALGGATSLSPQVEGRGDKDVAAPTGRFMAGEQVRPEQGTLREPAITFRNESDFGRSFIRFLPESDGPSGFMVPMRGQQTVEAPHRAALPMPAPPSAEDDVAQASSPVKPRDSGPAVLEEPRSAPKPPAPTLATPARPPAAPEGPPAATAAVLVETKEGLRVSSAFFDPPTPAPVEAPGMATAKLHVTMKNADNMDLVSGRTEQFLPHRALSAAALSDEFLAGAREDSTIPTSTRPFAPLHQPPPSAWFFPTPQDPSTPIGPATSVSSPALVTVLDRVQDLVRENTVQLKHLGAHSMAVVLKPDAHTELFLSLTLRPGFVEAKAELSNGDFAAFQAHWPALQADLAEHGIRLAPLTRNPGLETGGDAGSAHSQTHRRPAPDEPLPGEPRRERRESPAFSSPLTQPEPILAAAASGSWQSWA